MQAPPIDKRSYADIVAETESLAQQASDWRPRADGLPDAGQALIRIFGRFATLVVERLNRAPEKHELAFLNLIGTQPLPPVPARVPLTFALADSSPVDAVVPAGTQVAAAPLEGEEDEVLFETERNLVVTRAKLQAVFVGDAETDTWSDRTAYASGAKDEPWPAFTGDQLTPHQFYLACDQLLSGPGTKNVTLVLTSPDIWPWNNWPISWAYWDGAAWRAVTGTATVANGAWRVTFAQLPQLPPQTVNGIEAGWLRAQLDMALSPGESGLAPESVAVGNRQPQDLILPLAPFGDTSPVKWFYLSADDAIGNGRALVRFQVALARRGAGASVNLNWTYRVGNEWRPLGQSSAKAAQVGASDFQFNDGTQAFTRDGEISFHVPVQWTREFQRTRIGRWLRVEVADGGAYTTLPRIASLTVSYSWELPRVSGVSVQVNEPQAVAPGVQTAQKLISEVAFFNSTAVDLSKDFYPFGEQPRFNDTLYLSVPDTLAQPSSVVTLQVDLTNPTGSTGTGVSVVRTDGNPQIVWEASEAGGWREVGRFGYKAAPAAAAQPPSDGTNAFTSSGAVVFTLPPTLAATNVNGEERVWLRARLIGGDYGKAATYRQSTDDKGVPRRDSQGYPIYELVAATLAPPVVKSLSFKPVSVQSIAATTQTGTAPVVSPVLCQSYNDFVYRDLVPALAQSQLVTPFSPSAEPEPALYLGFDQPFDPRPATLYLQVEPPLPEEVAADELAELDPTTLAQITWEYSSPSGWRALNALDETDALSGSGLVSLVGPRDFVERACFGNKHFWLRARWRSGYFAVPPRLRHVLLNTMWAAQVSTIEGEILGSSNGNAGQVFQTAQTPVQPGQQLLVREREVLPAAEHAALLALEGADAVRVIDDAVGQIDEIWLRWHAVPDFYASGPRDRHYMLDPLSGEIRFGDGQHGLVPPQGQNNLRVTYRTGGGAQGNREATTIVQLKSGVPYIDGANNYEPAQGGADREPIERVKARGPQVLRHRDRAIAAQDLEDLAYEASADVARAVAVAPWFDPYNLWIDLTTKTPPAADRDKYDQVNAGRMGVIVVPNTDAARPTPSLGLLREVQEHLQARSPLTAHLWVAGPEWIRVTVTATVAPLAADQADVTCANVRAALERFLHPLIGGPVGQGWAFGRKPHRSDLFAVVEAAPGVDYVRTLTVDLQPETPDLADRLKTVLNLSLADASKQPTAPDLQRWLDRALVYSGQHMISPALT